MNDRGAFVVHEHVNYRLYPEDPYLPDSLIRRYGLKRGHKVSVLVQAPGGASAARRRADRRCHGPGAGGDLKVTPFEELIPYYPLSGSCSRPPRCRRTFRCGRSTS